MKNQRGILFVKNKQLLNTWLLGYCLQVLNFKKLFNKYLRIPKKLSPEAQQLLNNYSTITQQLLNNYSTITQQYVE
jgi:hypothetical protein